MLSTLSLYVSILGRSKGSAVLCLRPGSRPYKVDARPGGLSLETCLVKNACVLNGSIYIFADSAGAPMPARLPRSLDTRSIGGYTAEAATSARRTIELRAAAAGDSLIAFSTRYRLVRVKDPVVVSSEFNPTNFGHVIIDDVGCAFLAADAFGLAGDTLAYAEHKAGSGYHTNSIKARRISKGLKKALFSPGRLLDTADGFCASNIIAGGSLMFHHCGISR